MPAGAIVVYVSKSYSLTEFLYSFVRTPPPPFRSADIGLNHVPFIRRLIFSLFSLFFARLRYPSFGDPVQPDTITGSVEHELLKRRAGYLALFEKHDFYRQYTGEQADPLQLLMQLQEKKGEAVYLVPQLFLFGRRPVKPHRPKQENISGLRNGPSGLKKLLMLLMQPEKIVVEWGEPVSLRSAVRIMAGAGVGSDEMPTILRKSLMEQIDRHYRSITGPVLKRSAELKQAILTNGDVASYIAKHAERKQISVFDARKEAMAYVDEIAANYNPTVVAFGVRLVQWLLRHMFDGISVDQAGLADVKRMAARGPLILMPCHRSHMDYLVVPYLLYNQNIPWPHIFAGINLSFWPMGPFFRRVGAFFVRRSFAGAVFYAKVFGAYIHMLLKEGFNIKVYIEGTRSRSGKLLPPKLGMLNILLNACRNKACEDLIFVPIFVGYDRVPEEASYVDEASGSEKKTESVLGILKAGRLLKKRYGKIYVRFDRPFALSEILDSGKQRLEEMTTKAQSAVCRSIGYRAVNGIDRQSVVTPQSLVAAALLNSPKTHVTIEYLMFEIRAYLACLTYQNAHLSRTLLNDPGAAIRHILSYYARQHLIDRITSHGQDWALQDVIKIKDHKRYVLEYYKNNCVVLFIPAAFTALVILEKDAFQFSAADLTEAYGYLQDTFTNEFVPDTDRSAEYYIRKSIKAYIDDQVLIPHPTLPDTYTLTSPGFRKLHLVAAFLTTFFESYWIVLCYFKQFDRNTHDRDVRLKKIQSLGQRLYKANGIRRKEALSRINYTHAIEFFVRRKIRGREDMAAIRQIEARLEGYLRLLR